MVNEEMTGKIEAFNRSQFANKKIDWFDKLGVYRMNEYTNAEIKADGTMTGHFHFYDVSIVKKANGKITGHRFWFRDYLTKQTPVRNGSNQLHVWTESGQVEWYIDVPVSFKPLEDAIFEFIKLYS